MHLLKKGILLAMVALFTIPKASADEGMWLPIYLKLISGQMKKEGLKLTPDQIYSINNSSIKDAIVSMGGFCTGEIVSEQGLVFTNHHCGYDAIAELSTEKANYVDSGLWSGSNEEEIPVEGLYMSILKYMEDVSDIVNNSETPQATIDSIVQANSNGPFQEAEVATMFYGNEHYLMVYDVFRDIRLVGAPPSSIGSFGGETDNWMWPRHTGDFSVFRIYADSSNNATAYSENNVPYQPKHHLPISIDGYEEGSYTMVMGFPGRTQRYLPASSAKNITTVDYPIYVDLLSKRLEIMKEAMDDKKSVELALTSNYESLSNSRKYFKGVVERAGKSDFLEVKRDYQENYMGWVDNDSARMTKYGDVLDEIHKMDTGYTKLDISMAYLNFGGFGPGFVSYGFNYFQLQRMIDNDVPDSTLQPMIENLKVTTEKHFETYFPKMDEEITASLSRMMHNGLPEEADFRPDLFTSEWFLDFRDGRRKDRFDRMAKKIRKKSFLTDKKEALKFLESPDSSTLANDPGMRYVNSMISLYLKHRQFSSIVSNKREEAMSDYLESRRRYDSLTHYYPDANSTLRLTYGSVRPYPNDEGEMYNHYTTQWGILEKQIPGDEEFHIPAKLKRLLVKQDFGPYGENDTMHVCFIHDTDITGGNSGSPVMDGYGNLIGIAFDGNWESMLSDLYFEDKVTRTISVDIRYVLFIIDKFGESKHIMEELDIKTYE